MGKLCFMYRNTNASQSILHIEKDTELFLKQSMKIGYCLYNATKFQISLDHMQIIVKKRKNKNQTPGQKHPLTPSV